MRIACEHLVRGEITFAEFARLTAEDWRRLAAVKFRAAALPAGVELEDVVQEALLGAWFGARNYDSARSGNVHQHIVARALNRAGKYCADQRGRRSHKKGDWALPGQFPCSESFLAARASAEEGEPMLERSSAPGVLDWDAQAIPDDDRPVREAIARERVHALASVLGEEQRPMLECIADAGGSLAVAAELIRRHPDGEVVGAWGVPEAEALVRATAEDVLRVLSDA